MPISLESIGEWLLYEAIFPLSPVLLVWLGGRLLPSKKQTMFQLIRDGQLFFFCTALIAILLRDLGKMQQPVNIGLFGFLCLLLLAFGVLFGFVAMNKNDVDETALGLTSTFSVLLVLSLVLGVRVTERLL